MNPELDGRQSHWNPSDVEQFLSQLKVRDAWIKDAADYLQSLNKSIDFRDNSGNIDGLLARLKQIRDES